MSLKIDKENGAKKVKSSLRECISNFSGHWWFSQHSGLLGME